MNKESQLYLSRRKFLVLGATAALMPALVSCQPVTLQVADQAAGAQEMPKQDETLTAQFAVIRDRVRPAFQSGTQTPQVPGRTIRVQRGKTGKQLRIRLVNELDFARLDALSGAMGHAQLLSILQADPGNCPPDMNKAHGYRTINLHTHGLHVPPEKASNQEHADNVFIAILPKDEEIPAACSHHAMDEAESDNNENQVETLWLKEEAQYNFEIADTHPPGTYWYHTHKHGSVAWQIGQGLFGALIIEDEDDDGVPQYIRDATEHVVFYAQDGLQHKWFNDAGVDLEANPIEIQPGEVQRWRVINAAPREEQHIGFIFEKPDLEFYMIAFDGIYLKKRWPVTEADFVDRSVDGWVFDYNKDWAVLAPGNRADFLVRAAKDATPGEHRMRVLGLNHSPRQFRTERDYGLVVVGNGEMHSEWSEDEGLPGPKCLPDVETATIARQRPITLDSAREIEHASFDHTILAPPMVQESVEEWKLQDLSDEIHPFHIHVNSFLVTHYGTTKLDPDHVRHRWQDTLAVPSLGTVTFLMKFADHSGRTVMHCHNLRHEDQGMMRAVEIVP